LTIREAIMARRPSRAPSNPPASNPASDGNGASSDNARDKIIAAFLVLLAEKRFENIDLVEVAARAGLSLAEIRTEFASTLGIHAAHVKRIDRAVLSAGNADMAEESPRERLFDVLMRRLDALSPHKEAVRSLLRSVRRNPSLALAMNALAVRSQQWMLAAANIDSSGSRGMLRAQGLAVLYAQVLRVWIDDDDPGLARTMASLDRALGRGARWAGFLDDLCRLAPRCGPVRRSRRHGHDNGDTSGFDDGGRYQDDRDAPASA
jgi:AcrR family transcriptional regulator